MNSNLTDGLKVHTAHAEISLVNRTINGPVWTDGQRMVGIWDNAQHDVKWVAEIGCWVAA